MGIKNILYITRLVSEKDFTLTGPIEYKYVYGLRKLIGEENVKLTNSINIDDIEKFEAILLGRDVLDNLVSRKIVIDIIKKFGNKKVFAILDTFDDLIIDKIIYINYIKAYIKREILNIFLDKEILKRYILTYLTRKINNLNLLEINKFLNIGKLVPCLLTYHIYNEVFNNKKKYLVSYIVNLHPAKGNIFFKFFRYGIWKERIKIAKVIENIPNHYVKLNYAMTGGGLPLKIYYSIINSSYTSIAVISSSFDTVRRWEIPFYETVLISKKLPIIIPNDFIEGEHAFFYDNIKELKMILKELKGKEDELIKMGKKAREHVIKYHNPEARAKTILNALND